MVAPAEKTICWRAGNWHCDKVVLEVYGVSSVQLVEMRYLRQSMLYVDVWSFSAQRIS